MMKTIFFSGGGSGGHVLPAVTLIQEIRKKRPDIKIEYIGGKASIERELIQKISIDYHPITTGKLRRYVSLENLKDFFRVMRGVFDAIRVLWPQRKESLVFCTGGFVTVPVAFAAFILRVPVYIHEQTTRVGLANKICSIFAKKVFVSFEDSRAFFPKEKTLLSGYPLRPEIMAERKKPLIFQGIDLDLQKKPILFLTGGGNGSKPLNEFLMKFLPELSKKYLVIHQVGAPFIAEYQNKKTNDYIPVAFVGAEMIDLMKISKVIVSRAGAGTVCELMALGKPSILIPLKIAQKNEQFHNAQAAKKLLNSIVLEEDALSSAQLPELCSKIETVMTRPQSEDLSKGRDFLTHELLNA